MPQNLTTALRCATKYSEDAERAPTHFGTQNYETPDVTHNVLLLGSFGVYLAPLFFMTMLELRSPRSENGAPTCTYLPACLPTSLPARVVGSAHAVDVRGLPVTDRVRVAVGRGGGGPAQARGADPAVHKPQHRAR